MTVVCATPGQQLKLMTKESFQHHDLAAALASASQCREIIKSVYRLYD